MTPRLGAEEEFHVLDVESGRLVPRAGELLGRLGRPGFTGELQRSVVERNSGVHATLDGLYADLSSARRALDTAAADLGLAVVAAGTVPLARVTPRDVTADPRYQRMVDDYRLVADEQLICSAQVHVDVPDRDTAVRAMCLVSPWLPPLLALSASSPFWLGSDTGYASWRTMLWQRWPTAGPAGCHPDAAAYDAALAELIDSGVITDAGMVYHDVRPSAHQGTLELRICDACPRAETVVLVAGLFRALVRDACERLERADGPLCDGRHDRLRAAAWRAARSGLEGPLVDPVAHRAAPAPVVLRGMLARLRPALEASGDWDTVSTLLEEALEAGSAAHRLRRTAQAEDLLASVDLMVAETRGDRGTRRAAARPPHRTAPVGAGRVRGPVRRPAAPSPSA
ncbi:YbdK family carboxylate-amine ligase [Streptomyces sp. TG1A-8]|uniref:carboxylate-amine ligase n=1 Tax=Streptomyces sp. TG1A-8 TaxID=3051385 RepID=UPI00265B7CA8|nr:YbdK family carboxylate-amine ligase [Streptomyces sp. TG1A-8]MDO0924419.1 YbdK family carboxylate-amine ligase [Streptomyces sp. TG1A-8]